MTEGNWINLDALQLWERNYNRGDVAKIKRSVKKFGFNNALRVWNGTVMAGNHSTKALRELKAEGWTPTGGAIRVEGDAWLVQSVDLSHLRKDEAESFAIADNHIATEADPDMAALTALLKELELSMPDVVADIGFDEKEFAALMEEFGGSGEQTEAPEAQTDRAEELLEQWKVERGQLWIIPSKSGKGEHRLLCGDSTSADDVARLMGGESIDAVISDPPYGIGWDTDYTRFSYEYQSAKRVNYAPVESDDKPFDPRPYLDYPKVVLFGANWYCQHIPIGSWIVWDKRHPSGEAWLSDAELAWMKGGKGVYIYAETVQGAHRKETAFHPTQKPVGAMRFCIEKAKVETGEIVYDPFGGSGTTMVACEQLARQCRMIEIEPKYCAVILQRMTDMGLEARRAE